MKAADKRHRPTASDLLSAPKTTKRVGTMPAETWLESVDHDRYEVQEHSV